MYNAHYTIYFVVYTMYYVLYTIYYILCTLHKEMRLKRHPNCVHRDTEQIQGATLLTAAMRPKGQHPKFHYVTPKGEYSDRILGFCLICETVGKKQSTIGIEINSRV